MSQRVVIVGGGFGGLEAARALKRAAVDVTLIDRRNYHLFQPLLYQVATGALSPANIAAPLRAILRRQKNVEVLLGEVTGVDPVARTVQLGEERIGYDWLVVAVGVRYHYFGHDDWEQAAPSLKTIDDATHIRRQTLLAFEAAERASDPDEISRLLTFVVVGGGPTGVEMAGALAELAHHTLPGNFRRIDTRKARIVLVEGRDRVLPTYPPELSQKAESALANLGITVRTRATVTNLTADSVSLKVGEGTETILARTVLWAAGVQALPLGKVLADATGAATDRQGRVIVADDCSLPNHPEIFVIGDLANFEHGLSQPLPGVAPVAIQQGRYVAGVIRRRLAGNAVTPFRYRNYGEMATIGRAAAVVQVGRFRFNGFSAWLFWLFVHLMSLVGFENRVLVLVQWAWNYLTRNRAARLITGEELTPPPSPPAAAAGREAVLDEPVTDRRLEL